jgi:hypothetical protein
VSDLAGSILCMLNPEMKQVENNSVPNTEKVNLFVSRCLYIGFWG